MLLQANSEDWSDCAHESLLGAYIIIYIFCFSGWGSSEPGHSISYKIACAPSEDSDQPAHTRSLIRVFAGHLVSSQGFKASSGGQWRLCSSCDTGWSECSLGANAILKEMQYLGLYGFISISQSQLRKESCLLWCLNIYWAKLCRF